MDKLEERRRQQIINSGSARAACISEMEGRERQELPHRHARGKERNSTKVGPTKTYNLKGKLEFRRMDEEAKLGTYRQKSHVP